MTVLQRSCRFGRPRLENDFHDVGKSWSWRKTTRSSKVISCSGNFYLYSMCKCFRFRACFRKCNSKLLNPASHNPPMWGAPAGMKCLALIETEPKLSWRNSLKRLRISREPPTKFVPSSEKNRTGTTTTINESMQRGEEISSRQSMGYCFQGHCLCSETNKYKIRPTKIRFYIE